MYSWNLILYKVFPVANYNTCYSTKLLLDDTYKKETCLYNTIENFNIEWLKKYNIKYIFLSESDTVNEINREIYRIKDIDKIIQTKKILFQEGGAMFIELF